jgi:hypothetical protein
VVVAFAHSLRVFSGDTALRASVFVKPAQFDSPEAVIGNWLSALGLSQHAKAFVQNGYDSRPGTRGLFGLVETPNTVLAVIQTMTDDELSAIGIDSSSDRALILER